MPANIEIDVKGTAFAAYGRTPTGSRLATEIAKPKDWGAFQRNCVVLFREELRDPNTKEYGRNGQNQGGIDILGHRGADPSHPVGIQCRNVQKSLTQKAILEDCRAALALPFDLREIIFVTTAPDDVKMEKAAKAVERDLRAEGNELVVHIYGWGQLQTLIAVHEPAYNAFMPMVLATSQPIDHDAALDRNADFIAARVADEVTKHLAGLSFMTQPAAIPAGPGNIGSEDPALHAKIDILRDLIREGEARSAEQRLIALRDSPSAENAPWARYRIETNIAAALMDRGCEVEAADAYVRAHLIRPDDPDALANLAVARTIQGRPDEGMQIAQALLQRPDRTEFALTALLQAASHADWQGDPESLVPEEMRDLSAAKLGVADFMRTRWMPGWEALALALPDGDTILDHTTRTKALAVLSIAVDSRVHVVGGKDVVTDAQIDVAATQMQSLALHCLRNSYAHRHDLAAHVSNAALLLRLAGRHDDSEALLREGLRRMPDEDQLMRLLATALVNRGQKAEALSIIEPGTAPETLLMKVQFGEGRSAAQRLQALLAMEEPSSERVAAIWRRLIAEMALAARDADAARAIISDMLIRPDDVFAAKLLDVELKQQDGLSDDGAREALLSIASDVDDCTHPIDRFLVAEALFDKGLGSAAADLIENHIDFSSPRPATFLYLNALAESRRDDAYRTALGHLSPQVRDHPDTLWLDARHAWNTGDVERSLANLDDLLAIKPGLPKAILMRIEVLLRLGRSSQLLEALEDPIEEMEWKGGKDPYRVANLLSHFGFHDRAARYAYRLFLQHRDKPRAWMTLSSMTIREGQEGTNRPTNWSPVIAGPDVAVDVEYDDGAAVFFIIEPDAELRTMDPDSWEPQHKLAQAVSSLAVDSRFVGPDGRSGRITQLRHKIVARFHYVLANYEGRFPDVFGFTTMSIDTDSPNALDGIIVQLKERHDWVIAEQEKHLASGLPIDVLAARLGADTIDVAAGLAQQGIRIKVAEGTEPERIAAHTAIAANERQGCVLDLLSFWTAWRLDTLEQVAAVCGPISIPRSVVDRLQSRREKLAMSEGTGLGTMSYLDGKILHTEVPAKKVAEFRDDVDAALEWIEVNGAAKPLVLEDWLHAGLRDHVRSGRSDMLDALVLALTSKSILVCDDVALRGMHLAMGGRHSVWIHAVLGVAFEAGHITMGAYTQHTVDLIQAGQSHLGLSGTMIALGMEMDALEVGSLGARASALLSRLGGKEAEARSHLQAALEAMGHLWTTDTLRSVREAGTGMILRSLIRQRSEWKAMLVAVDRVLSSIPDGKEYVQKWARGHFLPVHF